MEQEPQSIEDRIWKIAERVGMPEGIEVAKVSCRGGGRNRLVRLFIDKPIGITHADCELISREVGTILDVEDFLPGPYQLEVSSPGLDRKLLKKIDYKRFSGCKARVKLRCPSGESQQLIGRLISPENGTIALETDTGALVQFRFEDVEQARLVVEF